MPTPVARKTAYGYKAVMLREDGSSRVCHTRNWKTRNEALEYAQRFIAANHQHNPTNEASGPRNGLGR